MPNRPNILFLMTDHTNAQSLAPGSQCLTPNLDVLAAEGRSFGRCYTPNAICSPARASLMTGLPPQQFFDMYNLDAWCELAVNWVETMHKT